MIINTPHIVADKNDFGKNVLLVGDPKRSKYIAEKFLTNYRLINDIRGVQGYTGLYKDKKISVMSNGMGMPSMLIYSYELFHDFNVDNIIRVGSCGAINNDIKLRDIIIANNVMTNSNIARNFNIKNKKNLKCSQNLLKKSQKIAKKLKICEKNGKILCSDIFYDNIEEEKKYGEKGVLAVEMESFALYLNAKLLDKNALCILNVADLVFDRTTKLSAMDRQTSFDKAIILALETLI